MLPVAMLPTPLKSPLSLAVLVTGALLLTACGNELSGTYKSEKGIIDSLTFRSGGVVDVSGRNQTKEGKFTTEGERITITVGNDTQVGTIESDGSIKLGGMVFRK